MAIYDINGNQLSNNGSTVLTFLQGKRYIAIGDSITAQNNTLASQELKYWGTDLQGNDVSNVISHGYVEEIEKRYGVVATVFGDGGGYIQRKYAQHIARDYSDVALVTIGYGTNDAHYSHPIGTKDSQDCETFAGCLHNLIRKILMDNPECRIIILTPPQRLTVNNFGSFTPGDGGIDTPTLEDYANMAKVIAERNSIACADIFHESGLNQTTLYYESVEGVHPLNNGYKRFSNLILPIIDNMLNVEYDTTGNMTVPLTPTSADNPLTNLDLTDDMFTVNATYWNSTDEAESTTCKQVATGIKLENSRTYLYTFYTTYNGLSNRMYAINNSSTEVLGSTCWGSADNKRGISDSKEVTINGKTYYKWTHAIAVPSTGDYYIWPSIINDLGAEYVELKYF